MSNVAVNNALKAKGLVVRPLVMFRCYEWLCLPCLEPSIQSSKEGGDYKEEVFPPLSVFN